MLLNISNVIYWAIKFNLIFQIIDAIEINRTMFNVQRSRPDQRQNNSKLLLGRKLKLSAWC